MSLALVWFSDGKFVDGRTIEPGDDFMAISRELPRGPKDTMYLLPEAAHLMREHEPASAVEEAMALLREARKEGY